MTMTRVVRETFRQFLPGAGRDVLGNPKQGKTRVSGDINVTSYQGGEGEPLSAADLGLSRIDSVTLRCADENSGAMTAVAGGGTAPIRQVSYTKSVEIFYLYWVDSDGQIDGMDAADSEVVEYVAEGDSAYDIELD
jgi:hypothetical protein